MVAFLLGLLKVIGITFLVLLILLLVIVGIVLFVPICYSGAGQITEERKDVTAKVTWLCKAIQCKVDYAFPEKPIIIVKFFGIDVMRLLEKRKKAAEVKQETEPNTASNKENKKATTKKQTPGINTSLLDETSHEEAEQPQVVMDSNTATEKETEDITAKEENAKEKIPFKEKLQTIIDKVRNIIYNIKYYTEVLQEEDTKQLIANAWEAILKILKSIRPREFLLNGEFGFATPDTTGKIYGMYAVVMPMVGEYIILEPNFEEQVLRGNVALKGRITIFVIVLNALRILFDKRLQPLIKKLKRGGNKNGRK
ncbi:MAG: hypothetical protein IJX63_14565 [Lachnospiraceae bacterium]|nr:hypothetical protein [Lachnospiraceae bacterium]